MEPIPDFSMRILHRGVEIDAKAVDGRIIDLVVRTQNQNGGAWRRFSKKIAYAFFRIGDFFDLSNNKGLPRVVEILVPGHASDDGLADGTDFYAVNRVPVRMPNGDARYEKFVTYEGVENHQLGLLGLQGLGFKSSNTKLMKIEPVSLGKSARDFHFIPDDFQK